MTPTTITPISSGSPLGPRMDVTFTLPILKVLQNLYGGTCAATGNRETLWPSRSSSVSAATLCAASQNIIRFRFKFQAQTSTPGIGTPDALAEAA